MPSAFAKPAPPVAAAERIFHKVVPKFAKPPPIFHKVAGVFHAAERIFHVATGIFAAAERIFQESAPPFATTRSWKGGLRNRRVFRRTGAANTPPTSCLIPPPPTAPGPDDHQTPGDFNQAQLETIRKSEGITRSARKKTHNATLITEGMEAGTPCFLTERNPRLRESTHGRTTPKILFRDGE